MTKEEKKMELKAQLMSLEHNQITEETIEKIKTLPKIKWEAYEELCKKGQLERNIKFKTPKSVFFDEENDCFVYFNPILRKLMKCAVFRE